MKRILSAFCGFVLATCVSQAAQTLTMATEATFPPYEFLRGQEVVGIDVEISKAVAQKLGFTGTDYPVSYTGGLFKSGECALAPLRRRIERAGAHLVDPELPPDVGALMMAIHHKHPERDLRDFRIIE